MIYLTIFNISYDLTAPGRDYEDLITAIKGLGAWAHPVNSTWLVETELSLSDVRKNLVAVMDSNDKLIVTICNKGATWQNLHQDVIDWVKQRL